MLDLLSTQQDAQAASEGWQLCHVFDLKSSRWGVRVLSASERMRNSEYATRHVITHARAGSALHIQALHLIGAAANTAQPKKGKKK